MSRKSSELPLPTLYGALLRLALVLPLVLIWVLA
jgi:hypothetical protein